LASDAIAAIRSYERPRPHENKVVSEGVSFYLFNRQSRRMTRDEIISRLKECEAELRAKGVAHAALFGSIARNEQRPDSDIDIMVEIAPEAHIGVFQYAGIVNYLEDLFPVRVDVANRAGLKSLVRPSAERDAIYAF
jgi:predicted nucleotidyltransferase